CRKNSTGPNLPCFPTMSGESRRVEAATRYRMSATKELMTTWTRRGFLGSLSATAAAGSLAAQQKRTGQLKITDLRCAIIGRNPVIRIVTDQGVSGYGQAESSKAYLKPMVLFYKDYLLGEDPTDVERVMLKIRRLGAFKPWGSAVSAIEIALWDIAGQVAGVPVYKLLGGKI